MAKLHGKEKQQFSKNLFVGVGKIIPIAFNPTKEELSIITNGARSFTKDIVYKFPDAQGEDSYKFDVWCKLNYVQAEDGTLVQTDTSSSDVMTDYVCYSWWGRKKQDIIYNEDNTIKGAWYVDPVICMMEWVPGNDLNALKANARRGKTRLDYSNPKVHIGLQGEKELYTFLETWLRIEEIDVLTPFDKILLGNYAEIKQLIKDNLNRSDRSPRGIKVFLGIKEASDNTYQSIYPYLILNEDNSNYNRLRDLVSDEKRPWKDDKSEGDYRLRLFSDNAPTTNQIVERPIPAPAKSSW